MIEVLTIHNDIDSFEQLGPDLYILHKLNVDTAVSFELCQMKKCLWTWEKYTDSDHPVCVQSSTLLGFALCSYIM